MASRDVVVLNGPNLNLLGTREPAVYGSATLLDVENLCRAAAADLGLTVECVQSNHEGVLIDAVHAAGRRDATVVINPGGYSHTSIALMDALSGVPVPTIEVHISNIHRREEFRHRSYVSKVAVAVFAGAGVEGYRYALQHARYLADALPH